jgi:hypothetical protein
MPSGKSRKSLELQMNGAHQLLAYSDDVNLLADNIGTIKKKKTLIDASKEIDLEINVDKTKYMLLSHHQNARLNRDIKIASMASFLTCTLHQV